MADTYNLAPIPKWLFTDNKGRPLAHGKMITYKDSNRSELKPVFRDPAGSFAWLDPIIFDAAGMAGPFYWKSDENYYLEIYSYDFSSNQYHLEFTISAFNAPNAGGTGPTTLNKDFKNFIINGQYLYNIGAGPSTLPTYLEIAPSATELITQPNIAFVKSNTNVTDVIKFFKFSLGFTDVEANPIYYCNYSCTALNSGAETFKYFQFPIKNVRSFENTQITISYWAKSTTSSTIEIYLNQDFGTGGSPSLPVRSLIGPQTLNTSWTKYSHTTVVPSAGGKILGTNGDDILSLQIQMPLNTICDIDHTNVQFEIGDITTPYDYQTYDMVGSYIFKDKTGDTKFSLNDSQFGWVPMNDGTIGNDSSTATTRANQDTYPLFKLIWEKIPNNYAPVLGGRGGTAAEDFSANKQLMLPKVLGRVLASCRTGVLAQIFSVSTVTNLVTVDDASVFYTGTPVKISTSDTLPGGLTANTIYYTIYIDATTIKLATSFIDAANNNAITFTTVGTGTQFIVVDYTNFSLGQTFGEEKHQLTVPELPIHRPELRSANWIGEPCDGLGSMAANNSLAGRNVPATGAYTTFINPIGGDQPHNTMQPTTFMNVLIKL
jgi:hypothetical protein